jgi:hypothetical protein
LPEKGGLSVPSSVAAATSPHPAPKPRLHTPRTSWAYPATLAKPTSLSVHFHHIRCCSAFKRA